MPYTSRFYPEYHLLSETLFGSVTLDEIRNVHAELTKTIETSETFFHVLVDLRSLHKFPTSIMQMKEGMQPIDDLNLHWMIILTNNGPLIKFAGSILIQLLIKNVRFRMFNSCEEAFAFLEDIDPSLHLTELLPELVQQL